MMEHRDSAEQPGKLTFGEVLAAASDEFGFDADTLVRAGSESEPCHWEPAALERARATVAFLAYRLLLMYRMKTSGAYKSNGAWVAMRHFANEIRKEIAAGLGIEGTERELYDEVHGLYGIASDLTEKDEGYRSSIDRVLETVSTRYGLNERPLGIIFA